jgi:PAS domain S-box-containing protein
MANADGWIFWYNQRWYEYTGTTPELMEGWGWQSVHDPQTLQKVVERWKSSIASGDPFDMVFPLRGADGVFHPFLTRVMPVRDHDGKVVRWFGTNTDISEQYRTEAALRHAFEQRQLALDAAELGAWDYRFETGDMFWDDACRSMHGVTSGNRLSYQEAISRIHSEDRPDIQEALDQAIAGGNDGAYHREYRVVWPDDSIHWIASHGRVRFEEEGGQSRPVHFTGVNMDITQRKLAELEIQMLNAELEQRVRQRTAQLETANQELEAFSYSVSHDLRAPLRGIDGWSLALIEDYGQSLDETARRYLERVRSETQRMGLLIDDMLQLSRVTRSEMKIEDVDLSALAHGVAGRLQEENPGRRIEFRIEDRLRVRGDMRLLEVALTNLLNNAVKFTGPRAEARIEFGLTGAAGEPAYFVRDNGVGFNMAYASSLFGAFQRLHKASEFPGTGIGLATVQRVVRRHDGRVWAEAVAGSGATFYFTIGEEEK